MSDKEKFEVDRNGDPMSYSGGMPPDWRFGVPNLAMVNSMSVIGSSSCSASMVDSFGPNFWDHSTTNSQNMGFDDINGSSSNTSGIRKDGFGFGRGGHQGQGQDHGTLEIGWNPGNNSVLKGDLVFPQSLSQFPNDSGFIERAARFSCFGGGNFSDVVHSYHEMPQSVGLYAGSLHGTSRDVLACHGLKTGAIGQSQENDLNGVEATNAVSPSVEHLANEGSPLKRSDSHVMSHEEGKQGHVRNANDSDRAESSGDGGGRNYSPMLEGTSGDPSIKGLNSKKRKRSGQNADNGTPELQSEDAKENSENQQKGDQQPTSANKASGKNSKQGSPASDPPKEEYIHVRARRGQATNSHSLAERVRREKISERMKFLQELVPGCSKVTGKAVMLDEIINYVQSLQRQVEFLSMKLATVNPRLDFNIEGLIAKDILQQRPGPSSGLPFPLEMSMNFPALHHPQPGMIQSVIPNIANSSEILRRSVHPQLTHLSGGFKEPNQMPDVWEDELHNVVQMSFATTAPLSSQDVDGTTTASQMKVEL